MKHALGLLAASLAAFASAAAAGQTMSQPTRRPGLWSMKFTYDDGAYNIPDSTLCLDPKSDRKMTLVGSQMRRSHCSEYSVVRAPDGGWNIRTVCTANGGSKTVTTGRITGDLGSGYEVVASSVTTGAKWSDNGQHKLHVSARWIGPCPTGERGGDVVVNGRTSNVFLAR